VTTSNDPYTSPASDLSLENELIQYCETKVFSFSGRIGRLRYLAYLMAFVFPFSFIFGLFSAAITGLNESSEVGILSPILLIITNVGILVFSIILAVRRLHDIGWSGYLSILYIIPIANLILGLLLVFMPGNAESNEYGAPPPPNTLGVKVMAFLLPAVAIIGILAAIAIPAYQDYVEKAAQTQQ
jgi:uncharacterized membrane protein YhaH (DUF805 family)